MSLAKGGFDDGEIRDGMVLKLEGIFYLCLWMME